MISLLAISFYNLNCPQEKRLFFQFFVRLEHIRKCFTMKEGVFVLEEYSKCKLISFQKLILPLLVPKSRKIVQRKYKSAMVSSIIQLNS